MTLSVSAAEALKDDWAISASGADDLMRAERLVNESLARRAVGEQIAFSFPTSETDNTFLERVALAFEMAAIEGLDDSVRTFVC